MAEGPPQNAPDEPADPNTSVTDSEDSDRDVFLSPVESQQGSPGDSPGHDDPEQTDQSEDSGQSQNSSNTNATTHTSDDEPNDDGRPSRLTRGKPVRRQRSRSHPPTQVPPPTVQIIHIHAPGERHCEECQQQEAPAQQNERATSPQRENPAPRPVPGAQRAAPPRPVPGAQRAAPPTVRGAPPQQVTRSGRVTMRPAVLGYQPGFAQHESRHPPQTFRLPRAVAPNQPKTAKPTDIWPTSTDV